jgi:hypothetical protein
MIRPGAIPRELPTHVRRRHARATPRADGEAAREVPPIFAESAAGPRVAQKTSHGDRDREHDDDRPASDGV